MTGAYLYLAIYIYTIFNLYYSGNKGFGIFLVGWFVLCERLSLDMFLFIVSFNMLHAVNLGIMHGWD